MEIEFSTDIDPQEILDMASEKEIEEFRRLLHYDGRVTYVDFIVNGINTELNSHEVKQIYEAIIQSYHYCVFDRI